MTNDFTSAVILVGGSGNRFGGDLPKQFSILGDRTVLEYTVSVFEEHPAISEIIIVSHPDYIETIKALPLMQDILTFCQIIPGGKTRQLSSFNGVMACDEGAGAVLIHDGARPFVTSQMITESLDALNIFESSMVAMKTTDTVCQVDDEGVVSSVLDRDKLCNVQTPQGFRYNIIMEAHQTAYNCGRDDFSDDCGMVIEYDLGRIKVVPGSSRNIKITYAEDLRVADGFVGT
jgi:ribitol-5-phosphate 2-dehydrogenase (NADP+) / D-ribitol-5-phosphate cytidylyltransferase